MIRYIPKASGSNLVCEPIPQQEHMSKGGIVIQEREPTQLFRVLSVGPGPLTDSTEGTRVPLGYSVGDVIAASRTSSISVGGQIYAVIAEVSVLALVEELPADLVRGVSFSVDPRLVGH